MTFVKPYYVKYHIYYTSSSYIVIYSIWYFIDFKIKV
jgi:hypothetical protein